MKFLDRSIYLFAPEKNRSSFLAKRYADRLVTERIDMLIAIAPAVFWAVYAYGIDAVKVILVCTGVSLAADALCTFAFSGSFYNLLDLSSIVYGVLVSLLLSPKADLMHAVLLSLCCTLIFKNLLGRFARIRINPAALALTCFALLVFAQPDFVCVYPFGGGEAPTVPELVALQATQTLRWYEIFFGEVCSPIGCASALLLIAGGLYLGIKKITDIRIPLSFIAGICITAYLLSANANPFEDVVFFAVCGQTHFTAFFLCADKTYAPRSKQHALPYGLICGALCGYICMKISPVAAFPLSVVICNVLARILDLFYKGQKPFGLAGKGAVKNYEAQIKELDAAAQSEEAPTDEAASAESTDLEENAEETKEEAEGERTTLESDTEEAGVTVEDERVELQPEEAEEDEENAADDEDSVSSDPDTAKEAVEENEAESESEISEAEEVERLEESEPENTDQGEAEDTAAEAEDSDTNVNKDSDSKPSSSTNNSYKKTAFSINTKNKNSNNKSISKKKKGGKKK